MKYFRDTQIITLSTHRHCDMWGYIFYFSFMSLLSYCCEITGMDVISTYGFIHPFVGVLEISLIGIIIGILFWFRHKFCFGALYISSGTVGWIEVCRGYGYATIGLATCLSKSERDTCQMFTLGATYIKEPLVFLVPACVVCLNWLTLQDVDFVGIVPDTMLIVIGKQHWKLMERDSGSGRNCQVMLPRNNFSTI